MPDVDLATLFERPPATEADLAGARARFLHRAARSRPRRDRNLLKALLAALATTLVAVTAAVALRPLPATQPPPKPPEPSEARQALLTAADAAAAQTSAFEPGKPGEYLWVVWFHQGWDPRKGEVTTFLVENWSPSDGKGPWLRSTGRHETLFARLCPSQDPSAWSPDLRAEITAGDVPGRFGQIAAMLEWTRFHPERAAALLRLAAELPGLTVTRGQTDAKGRPAFTVGLALDGLRDELVFDEPGNTPLGRRTVVTRDTPQGEGRIPAGTVIGHTVDLYGVEPKLPRKPAKSASLDGEPPLRADQVKRVEREARCD
ncbi:hypothetical protein FDA94_21085 [Herbidospora galbida]|uniref:CU044_5270 family protein n=1 Tax=Herbidospora galbida TaxID=2575442 RepID=A0A4U3MBK5_9ACTN|nr:hypothetical protein [Herbidospora galbida]TKK86598.1 hypothetical protein FDA94_21085 [Herbidospora galbida]